MIDFMYILIIFEYNNTMSCNVHLLIYLAKFVNVSYNFRLCIHLFSIELR